MYWNILDIVHLNNEPLISFCCCCKDWRCWLNARRHWSTSDLSQFQTISAVSSPRFKLFLFLYSLPDIKSISGNLAESRYLLRHGLFPWLTQNIFWHIFSTGSWGRGGQRGPTAKQVPGGVRVPAGTSCLFPLLHYHLPPSVSPFIYSLSLAPSRSHPGIWWIGVGGYRRSGSGYGKRQSKHYKERGFSFQF